MTQVPWTSTGQGPGVVLLHGSADSPSAWQAVVRNLAEQFTVWAPPLPPIATPLALDTDLPWLDALLDHSGARVLAGHSYGALLALRWALAHPGRLDRLVLAEPIAWGVARDLPDTQAKLTELGHCLTLFAAGDQDGAMAWLVDYWNGAGFWQRLPDKVRTSLLAGAGRTRAEVSNGAADHTSMAELATLHVPTVLLAGERTTPESQTVSQRIAKALPHGQFLQVPGAGHQFLRSHPDAVAEACAA